MALSQFLSKSPIARLAARVAGRRDGQLVAAVDLGSNSFHLIIARLDHGELHVLDRLQEMVRLGGGLDAQGRLDRASQRRALECLARFGERLRDIPRANVSAVGTNTLRRARNAGRFLAAARKSLGHPIEIISGQEEARLIYQGVAHHLPAEVGERLVLDIGGGSTEIILGHGFEPKLAESLHVGCVSASNAHFPGGRITRKRWNRAETAARLEFEPVAAQFRKRGWQAAYGSSGTIRAVAAVAREMNGADTEALTPQSLRRLRDRLLEAGHVDALELPGLSRERAPVFPGGVAILMAAFEALGIEQLRIADGALREGLVYDLLGRIQHADVRSRTIAALTARYRVDTGQAERVAHTARALFDQVASDWQLAEEQGQWLDWAARLHELGLAIAHTKYHRHGAYLVEHSDLAGFTWEEQRLLAALIRVHRRRFAAEVFATLPKKEARVARRFAVLLRLAVLLHRGRHERALPAIGVKAQKKRLRLRFPAGWIERNPLTCADLNQEADYLKSVGFSLKFS